MDPYRFCETYFTSHSRVVANKSAISPFLGGTSGASDVTSRISCACLGPTFFLGCFCENPVNSFETHETVPDRRTVVRLLIYIYIVYKPTCDGGPSLLAPSDCIAARCSVFKLQCVAVSSCGIVLQCVACVAVC